MSAERPLELPQFLIGESYGTFRSAALGNYLQEHDGMDFQRHRSHLQRARPRHHLFPSGSDMPYIFYLPSYAATAWYHRVLKDRPADVVAFIDEARKLPDRNIRRPNERLEADRPERPRQ